MRSTKLFRTSALLAATVTLVAGCGGSDGDDGGGVDVAKFRQSFKEATGVTLTERESPNLTILRPQGQQNYSRFGVFSIYVYEDKDDRERALQSGASSLKEYDGGILLSAVTGDRDEGVAQRLDQAMRAAVADDPSLVPARERACGSVGIDPATGREGTCRLPDKQLTVVNAGTELKTSALSAELVGATTVSVLPARSKYLDPKRARGRYVVVRFKATNNATAPVNNIRTNLVIGQNTYAESSDSYTLSDPGDRPYPLQPGAEATFTTAYDIPEDAAAAALQQGAIELPGASSDGSAGYLTDRESVGRIRLSGAPEIKLSGSTSSSSSSSSTTSTPTASGARRKARIASAESALKEFYRALRKGNVRYVCRRLTEAVQKRFGGATACRQGRLIKSTAKSKAPKSTSGLRLSTVLTRNETRALIVVRGNGFTDLAKLARQDGLWRVQGTRQLTGG